MDMQLPRSEKDRSTAIENAVAEFVTAWDRFIFERDGTMHHDALMQMTLKDRVEKLKAAMLPVPRIFYIIENTETLEVVKTFDDLGRCQAYRKASLNPGVLRIVESIEVIPPKERQ